jgi:hypothetical protein
MAPTDVPSNVTEDFYFSEVLQPSPVVGISSHSRSKNPIPEPTHGYHGHSSQALSYVKYLWSRRELRWKDRNTAIRDEIEDLLQFYTYL